MTGLQAEQDEDAKEDEGDDGDVVVGGETWHCLGRGQEIAQCARLQACRGEEHTAKVHFEQINSNAYLPGVGLDAHASSPESRSKLPLFYFCLLFPIHLTDRIVDASNHGVPDGKKLFDAKIIFQFFGVVLAMTLQRLPNKRDYWAPTDASSLFPSPNFARFMSRSHFDHFHRY